MIALKFQSINLIFIVLDKTSKCFDNFEIGKELESEDVTSKETCDHFSMKIGKLIEQKIY